MNEEILRMEQISVTNDGAKILDNTWINLFRGEIVGLLGLNDSGKSCMMRVLTGACPDYTGKIWVEEQPVKISSRLEARRHGIFLIPRSLSLVPDMNITENIFLILQKDRFFVINHKKQHKQAKEILSRFQITLNERQMVRELTYYQKFLVEICKVAVQKPKIVIVDGILSRFSITEIEHAAKIFRILTRAGISLILIDHRLMPITALCSRIFVLRRGCNAGISAKKCFSESLIFSQMVGAPTRLPDILEISGHSSRLSDRQMEFRHVSADSVWTDISFRVRCGEILGLINIDDPDGSTWRKLLFGESALFRGSISVNGEAIPLPFRKDARRRRIGLVMEPFYLFQALSLRENIVLPAMAPTSRPFGVMDAPQLKYLVNELASCYISDQEFESSFFQHKKINALLERETNICKVLSGNPDYVIFVNPTQNLDAPSKHRLYQDILSIKQHGKGILLQSASIDDLISVCDRLVIIKNTRLIECSSKISKQNFMEEYGRCLSET